MLCRLTKAGLMKFPVHPESIKALADALLICTYTTKLLAYRVLLAAIRCGPGRSFQGLPSGGSSSFPPHAVVVVLEWPVVGGPFGVVLGVLWGLDSDCSSPVGVIPPILPYTQTSYEGPAVAQRSYLPVCEVSEVCSASSVVVVVHRGAPRGIPPE